MKRDKNFYYNIIAFVGAPILFVIGVVTAVRGDSNRLKALGGLLILLAIMILLYQLTKFLVARSEKKTERLAEKKRRAEDKKLGNALVGERREFVERADFPQTNTVKIIGAGVEFFAEGRYVCEHNFKGVNGYHLAFEINSTELKHMPKNYDDVCDIEGTGIVIAVGYHDGEPLEKYANDNGIVLRDKPENSIGITVTLKRDNGYSASVWTAEGDDIDYGFVKILKCENDVLTVCFRINVSCGLCDFVEGTVELKKDTIDAPHDINTLISKIKRKKYNIIEVDDDEVQAIRKTNPFLPESYIKFLSELGYCDLDWIDVGWNAHTPTNLDDGDVDDVKDKFAKCDGDYSVDDFYFIGIDNDGRHYAFSRKANDGKVYVFSSDDTYVLQYDCFEEFLIAILYV